MDYLVCIVWRTVFIVGVKRRLFSRARSRLGILFIRQLVFAHANSSQPAIATRNQRTEIIVHRKFKGYTFVKCV